MANWLSQQKGKVNSLVTNLTLDGSSVLTSELNKLWRAKIILNRLTSDLPKDTPTKGRSTIPNGDNGTHYSKNVGLRNPDTNKSAKEKARSSKSFLKRGQLISIEHGKTNREELVKSSKNHNLTQNKVIIFNLNSKSGYQKIVLQNRPSQVDFRGETSWATIKSMGRNNPMYHYTGSEDTIQFNISWFCNDPNNYEEVVTKCRLLESWTKSDGYTSGPPVLIIDWGGNDGLFKGAYFILTSATYTLSNFQSGNIDMRDQNPVIKNTKLYPMAATQELVFKRVSAHNLKHQDIVSTTALDKTLGSHK